MNGQQYIQFYITKLEQAMPDLVERMAIQVKAVAQNKIQSQGVKGKQYSRNKLPVYYFYDSVQNASGRRLLESEESKREGLAWRDIREAEGKQTNFVDLTYTGNMWRGFNPSKVSKVGSAWYAHLQGTNIESKEKLTWNYERYGDFINSSITQQEKTAISNDFTRQIINILNS